jgi:hypothetical protein
MKNALKLEIPPFLRDRRGSINWAMQASRSAKSDARNVARDADEEKEPGLDVGESLLRLVLFEGAVLDSGLRRGRGSRRSSVGCIYRTQARPKALERRTWLPRRRATAISRSSRVNHHVVAGELGRKRSKQMPQAEQTAPMMRNLARAARVNFCNLKPALARKRNAKRTRTSS